MRRIKIIGTSKRGEIVSILTIKESYIKQRTIHVVRVGNKSIDRFHRYSNAKQCALKLIGKE